jgi:hypothetical protein
MIAFLRHHFTTRAARKLGKLGGKARAEQQRIPIRETARRIRKELGLPEDRRLA